MKSPLTSAVIPSQYKLAAYHENKDQTLVQFLDQHRPMTTPHPSFEWQLASLTFFHGRYEASYWWAVWELRRIGRA